MTFTLPYPPSANRAWMTVRGMRHPILTPEARQYRKDAGIAARRAGVIPLSGPVAVTMRVYRPRKARDLDNAIKVLFDAMNGIAWIDDKQVVELHAFRRDDPDHPRVDLEIVPVAEQADLPLPLRHDPAEAIR